MAPTPDEQLDRNQLIAGLRRWRTKARHLAGDKSHLVGEKTALRADVVELEGRVVELEGENRALRERVATLSRLCFGTSSEKATAASGNESDATATAQPARSEGDRPSDSARRPRGQRPGSVGHGRRDYSELESEEVVHDVAEHERICPHCGAPYKPFGEESSSQIDWQVRIVRVVHRRRRYRRACRCATKALVVAPVPPKPIPKGLFTSQFLARLLFDKYVLGRPMERIVSALEAEGLRVAKGSLTGTLRKVSDLLEPLDEAIRARNRAAGHLHVDETSWSVFEDLAGKANHRWWLWVFVAPDTVVFDIDPTRSAAVLERHLGIDIASGTLEAGRSLVVSSDFFTVYQSLASVDGVEALWCFAHIRRYFIRAGDAHKVLGPWRDAWLCRFAALYRAHHGLRSSVPGTPEHEDAAGAFALALGEIDVVREKQAATEDLHPAARKVLSTLDHEWEGLRRHGDYPEADLDNNASERALRGPVVGRKNYYGSGAIWAATLAERVWTISATAKRAGLNPLTYLHAYLGACAGAGGRALSGTALSGFLPWSASTADLACWRGALGGPSP